MSPRPRRSPLFPYTTLFRSYLVMAATLIHIKSKMLLPRPETAAGVEGDEEDPRDALVRRLLEHQKYKAAAGRSEEHTSELQSQSNLVCRLLLEKKNNKHSTN